MSYAKVRAILDAAPDDVFAAFQVIEIAPALLAVAEAADDLVGDHANHNDIVALRTALAALDAKMKETLT